jgi:membrane peptidoglycan carboxypeptidase
VKLRFKVLAAAGGLLAAAAVVYYLLPFCVWLPQLTLPPESRVTDRHGELLGYVPGADGYRSQSLETLPPQLVRALLAAEDKRFYAHGGVDALALLRAVWQQVIGQGKSGASTISMQVAKMYSPPAPRTWRTKLREMLQARRLEMQHSKEELLLAYLNRADFSNMCRGAETAARLYFGKGAGGLTAPESALLVALVKSPTKLNPVRHPAAALKRRNLILLRMGEAVEAPLGILPRSINAPAAAGGVPGQLTLDAALQARCAAIARAEVEKLRSRNVSQAAVVVADNRTGEVLGRCRLLSRKARAAVRWMARLPLALQVPRSSLLCTSWLSVMAHGPAQCCRMCPRCTGAWTVCRLPAIMMSATWAPSPYDRLWPVRRIFRPWKR